jgi:hypothetical protein
MLPAYIKSPHRTRGLQPTAHAMSMYRMEARAFWICGIDMPHFIVICANADKTMAITTSIRTMAGITT